MNRFDYQHLDGLAIEADKGAVRIDYSTPDQGGTRLLTSFRIFIDGHIERDSGYAHDGNLRTKVMGRDEMPHRVIVDGLSWILEQTRIAAGKTKQLEALKKLELALKKLETQETSFPSASATSP